MKELVEAKDIAEILKVKVECVRRWAKDGKIPSYKLGYKTRRFNVDEVLEALKNEDLR